MMTPFLTSTIATERCREPFATTAHGAPRPGAVVATIPGVQAVEVRLVRFISRTDREHTGQSPVGTARSRCVEKT